MSTEPGEGITPTADPSPAVSDFESGSLPGVPAENGIPADCLTPAAAEAVTVEPVEADPPVGVWAWGGSAAPAAVAQAFAVPEPIGSAPMIGAEAAGAPEAAGTPPDGSPLVDRVSEGAPLREEPVASAWAPGFEVPRFDPEEAGTPVLEVTGMGTAPAPGLAEPVEFRSDGGSEGEGSDPGEAAAGRRQSATPEGEAAAAAELRYGSLPSSTGRFSPNWMLAFVCVWAGGRSVYQTLDVLARTDLAGSNRLLALCGYGALGAGLFAFALEALFWGRISRRNLGRKLLLILLVLLTLAGVVCLYFFKDPDPVRGRI